jgi:hypothetical protein
VLQDQVFLLIVEVGQADVFEMNYPCQARVNVNGALSLAFAVRIVQLPFRWSFYQSIEKNENNIGR